MTYIPPVNGGRINATIGGNTAGASTLVSTGTLTLAGGNNITLSQNGNAITISGGAGAAGSNTLGMSNLGNTSGTTGVVSGSALRYLFAGGNNVTLSQSINASSATVTISAANQTVQTQNLFNLTLSGNTAGAMAQVSSGTLTLAGGNNITLSQNGNAVSIIGAAAGNGLGALANSQTTYTSGTVNLLEGGGALTIASTTGQKFNFSVPQTSSLAATGIVSVSSNGSTISIGASQSVQTQNLHNITLSGNTTGTLAHISSGTLTLAGGNNITLSQNGNAVTISAANGGGGGGVAIANSQATYTSGTVNLLEGGGAITIASSAGGQSLKVSVPATSSLSATGAVSISTNGSTISIGAPAPTTLSRFEYPSNVFTSLQTQGQGSLSLQHVYVPYYVTATAMKIGGSLSGVTNTSATTASADVSLWMGIYTLNGSTLSLASSGSANNGFQWSQSGSSTGNTSINSMRQMTVPMNVNLTPGEYWMAVVMSSATTYTNFSYWIYGNDRYNAAATAAVLSPIGSNTSVARDAFLFQGIYTAATSVGPASIAGSQINITSVSNVMRANFYFALFNATY